MKKIFSMLTALFVISVLLGGCLTVEKKEYVFEFTGENSGILTIRYINIMSVMDEEADVSETDFDELVNSYLYGSELEDEYPMAVVTGKRLYEENEMLCAEVIIEFADLAAAKLHQFDKDSYYMYALCQCLNSESFFSSNGSFGSEEVPVIIWPSKFNKLELTTLVTEPDETTISLLPNYQAWE
ncbi:MAG: hypothetical protein IH597_15895 [Bacteroidales bacterium]|nr:hypothetical protein [Bacteroidales bacterium]